MELTRVFDRVCCISLRRRPDRWARFVQNVPPEWPFAPVERVAAVDGRRAGAPDWWSAGGGAWGCYRSHLRVIEDALNDGVESLLIFEDDATFESDFAARASVFLQHVPDDWGMLYLGGQHLKVEQVPPRFVNEHVCIPYNVNRTHAMALRGPTLEAVYRHLASLQWRDGHHIDHHLGRFVERRDPQYPVYCPTMWLVGQAAGESDIASEAFPERFWDIIKQDDLENARFVAIVGTPGSGVPMLAGVARSLGILLIGRGDANAVEYRDRVAGGQDADLADICESFVPFLATELVPDAEAEILLDRWILRQMAQSQYTGSIAGGANPLLSALGQRLHSRCGQRLRLIVCQRELAASARELETAMPHIAPNVIESHLAWLDGALRRFTAMVPDQHQISVNYDDLVRRPEREAFRMVQFLDMQIPGVAAQITKAVAPIHLAARATCPLG